MRDVVFSNMGGDGGVVVLFCIHNSQKNHFGHY